MSKTYADECLERVRKATPKPWFNSRTTKSIKVSKDSPAFDRGDFVICRYPTRTNNSLLSHEEWEGNSEFIAHARTDVEELATRLNMAIEALQKIGYWKSDANICCFPVDCYALAEELESIPK